MSIENMKEQKNQLRGNRHGEIIDVDTLWMTDLKTYKETQEHFSKAIGNLKASKVSQMVVIENPTGLDMLHKDNKKEKPTK